jgi:ABC-type transport system substrate-binding protein
MPGYDETIEALPFDPEGARQLLEDSSYGGAEGLPDLTLTIVGQGGEPADTIAAIVAQWEENLGVTVELQQVEYATYLRELRQDTFQFFQAGWIADYPDPENFLDKLFHSESQQNELGYHNDEVDALLDQARTEQDQEVRFSLYHEVERQVIDDAVVIPLWWPKTIQLVKPYVEGYLLPPIVIPKLRYVTLTED